MPLGMISHIGIEMDRLEDFDTLFRGALATAAAKGLTAAVLIASIKNPLFNRLKRHSAIRLHSRMYAVAWKKEDIVLDGRPAQLETSMA